MADMRGANCAQCGSDFQYEIKRGRPRRFCSKGCCQKFHSSRSAWTGLVCVGCGIRFDEPPRQGRRPKKCASCRECPEWHGKCSHCAEALSGRKRKYCDTGCRIAARRKSERTAEEVRAERRAKALLPCKGCGAAFMPSGSHNRYCSIECSSAKRKEAAAQRALGALWVKVSREAVAVGLRRAREIQRTSCIECGERVETERVTRYGVRHRCVSCAARIAAESRQRYRRKRKAMDRARLRNARVEPVDPIKVFERDGWRCHICQRMTKPDKRGTYHPLAPELDHITPLSKGGDHSYLNTACSCRQCNGAKSDRVFGQPSLFAA